ncbi:MAG TPA: energy transducer TonB, partial [bacterium]|nr:energy transducer TonB [bacterium]
ETGLESVRNQVVTGPATTIEDRGGVAALGPVVAPPPPPPQTPVRLHSGIKAPVKIVDASPEYPGVARQARVTGVVILEATIGVRGDVQAVRVLRSIPLLDRAAVDAVQRWKFTPALLNGVPVPVIVTVTVNFTLR